MLYAIDKPLKKIRHPLVIELTNRLISAPLKLTFDETEYLDVILKPRFIDETSSDFFTFVPELFALSHLSTTNEISFFITPNVDCPLIIDAEFIAYFVIQFDVQNGSLAQFAKPSPLYIRVLSNEREFNAREDWCTTEIDCQIPPNGMTCIPDECLLKDNTNSNSETIDITSDSNVNVSENITNSTAAKVNEIGNDICLPLTIQPLTEQNSFNILKYMILFCIVVLLTLVVLHECGCLTKVEIPELMDDDSSATTEEKKIFNTAENLREAQIAIEHLLFQIKHHERNLDIHRQFKNDVHRKDAYYDN
jgi:hypothetical protein